MLWIFSAHRHIKEQPQDFSPAVVQAVDKVSAAFFSTQNNVYMV